MLEAVDLSLSLSEARYKRLFPKLQDRLRVLQYALREAQIPTLVVFEGWDAAGKSTVIRRLTEHLDPRAFRHVPSAPPSDLEKRFHFLWRYQVGLPEDGQMAFFDHSWYGRVLVERVEKLTPKRQWKLAYDQINEFERWLDDDGQLVVKFFLHIAQGEQKRRFRRMEKDDIERWKVQKEDWRRNRRYDRWAEAVEEMLERTSTAHAPWNLIPATDFRYLRTRVFSILVERIEQVLADRKAKTPAAADAEKRQRVAEAGRRARATAREAGLPIEGS